MITPKKMLNEDDVPFLFYTLDPQTSFVVYYSGLGHRALMGVTYVVNEDNRIVYSVYTRNTYFEIINNAITKEVEHILGGIPIIEYPADKARLGAFEVVLPLLDAINEVDSGRLDGVQQFIESLLVLKGVDITDDNFKKLKELGGLKLPIDGDASYLSQELNQSQIQELADNLYQVVLTICGMPNRNGGSSTSDTGAAVIMRDGWSDAESRAKNTEKYFKRSEKLFLRLAINIANTIAGMDMKLYTINIRFTRRNYENIEGKANVLVSMLSNNKIHPKLAFEHCGMFVDPELAYTISKEYAEEYESKLAKSLSEYNQSEIDKEKQIIDDSDEG
jgi:SPP1 family phage portal protein